MKWQLHSCSAGLLGSPPALFLSFSSWPSSQCQGENLKLKGKEKADSIA
jgi:hypothetical protein